MEAFHVYFHQLPYIWVSCLQEPESFYFVPNIPLADEDNKKEEPSEHVEAVDYSEEDFNEFVGVTGSSIMMVNDKMDTFNNPQHTQNKEYFQVQNLKQFDKKIDWMP